MADVLKTVRLARLQLQKNGIIVHNQSYAPTDEAYTESTGDRIVLATNMASPQQYNLGGVSTAKNLFLKTDQTIKVGLNSTTALWTVSDFLMVVGSFTSLYVKNENTTREATIDVLVTD